MSDISVRFLVGDILSTMSHGFSIVVFIAKTKASVNLSSNETFLPIYLLKEVSTGDLWTLAVPTEIDKEVYGIVQ